MFAPHHQPYLSANPTATVCTNLQALYQYNDPKATEARDHLSRITGATPDLAMLTLLTAQLDVEQLELLLILDYESSSPLPSGTKITLKHANLTYDTVCSLIDVLTREDSRLYRLRVELSFTEAVITCRISPRSLAEGIED